MKTATNIQSTIAAQGADRYITDIVFRPGYAVGLAYLRNPRGAPEERQTCSERPFPASTCALIPRWITSS